LGREILKDSNFSQGTLVSVIAVEVSKDARWADVRLSVYPQSKEKEVLRFLNQDTYRIQQVLNKKLHIKYVPQLRFHIDSSLEQVEKLFNSI